MRCALPLLQLPMSVDPIGQEQDKTQGGDPYRDR